VKTIVYGYTGSCIDCYNTGISDWSIASETESHPERRCLSHHWGQISTCDTDTVSTALATNTAAYSDKTAVSARYGHRGLTCWHTAWQRHHTMVGVIHDFFQYVLPGLAIWKWKAIEKSIAPHKVSDRLRRGHIQDGPIKNVALYFCPHLRQLLTDFQNSFTGTLCRHFRHFRPTLQWMICTTLNCVGLT